MKKYFGAIFLIGFIAHSVSAMEQTQTTEQTVASIRQEIALLRQKFTGYQRNFPAQNEMLDARLLESNPQNFIVLLKVWLEAKIALESIPAHIKELERMLKLLQENAALKSEIQDLKRRNSI